MSKLVDHSLSAMTFGGKLVISHRSTQAVEQASKLARWFDYVNGFTNILRPKRSAVEKLVKPARTE